MPQAFAYSIESHRPGSVDGVSRPSRVNMLGVAKRDAVADPPEAGPDTSTAVVARELVAFRLGAILGLPMVPGLLATDGTANGPYYVSMLVGVEHTLPPPVVLSKIMADHPGVVAGMCVFDTWIHNRDRHYKNVIYIHGQGIGPLLIDHSHAFNGPHRRTLATLCDDAVLADALEHQTTSQRFTCYLKDWDEIERWIRRCLAVDLDLLDPTLTELIAHGVMTSEEAGTVKEFLALRRANLQEMLMRTATSIDTWKFDGLR